jgi:hypothetical protein
VSYVRERFNLSQQRADELIRIGDGRTTVEQTRAIRATSERARRQRERPTPRGVGTVHPEPETAADAPPDDIRNHILLKQAKQALQLAKFGDLHGLKISKDVEAAVLAAARAWHEVLKRVTHVRNSEAA